MTREQHPGREQRWVLWTLGAIVVAYVVLALGYSHVTPYSPDNSHNPDEAAHFGYIQALAAGHLPVLRADRLSVGVYEAHQPPLYYLLCVPVYDVMRGHGVGTVVGVLRVFSILLGAMTVLAVFAAARALFRPQPLVALGGAGFVALLPMFDALSASVTNDALADLWMAMGFLLVSRLSLWDARRDGPPGIPGVGIRDVFRLGVITSLAVWTKLLCLPLLLVSTATLMRVSGQCLDVRRAARLSLGMMVVAVVALFVRNQVLYGDVLASGSVSRLLAQAHVNTSAHRMIQFFGGPAQYVEAVAQWTQASFWGGFDSMRLFWGQPPGQSHPDYSRPPGPIYGLLLVLAAASVLGLLRLLRSDALCPPLVFVLRCGGFLIMGASAFLVQLNSLYFQAQGRFLFPALAPLAVDFILGWQFLLPGRRFGAFLLAFGLFLLALNVYTLFGLLAPRFHGG